MAFSFIATDKAGSATGGTTPAINTTGATLIILSTTYSSSATVSDSKGNTWTGLTTKTTGGGATAQLFYCLSPTTDSAHTFTISGVVGAIIATAFSSATAPAFDVQQGGVVSGATFGTVAMFGSFTLTPTNANSLVFAANATATAGGFVTYVAASGWTLTTFKDLATSFGIGSVYQIQTTATAIPDTQHISEFGATVSEANVSAVFYETAGVAASPGRNQTLTGAGY